MHSYLAYIQTPHRRLVSYGTAVIFLLLVLSGALDRPNPSLHVLLLSVGGLLFWLAWELYQGVKRFWIVDRSVERSYDPWMGMGFAILVGVVVLLRLSGGLSSPFYPLFYIVVSFLASFGTASQGTTWFGYALMLELVAILASGIQGPGVVGLGSLHLFFLGLFAGSHHLFLHAMLQSLRANRNARKGSERSKSVESEILHDKFEEEKTPSFSLQTLESEQQVLLSLLKEGLDAHGCTFLWLDPSGASYEVSGIDTNAERFDNGPFSTRSGAPAGLFKTQNNLRLSRSSDTGIHLPYYGRELAIRSFLAVPIREGGQIRGALCVDRVHPAPFSARDEALLEATAIVLGRALRSEHSYHQSSRDLQALNLVHDLGQKLNQAQTSISLAQETLDAATAFVSYDWGFVSRYDAEERSHQILAGKGQAMHFEGEDFSLEGSLLSLAFKHGCPLPEGGNLRSSGPYIASSDPTSLPPFQSITMIPLMLKGEAVGSLVLAANTENAFGDSEVEKNLGTLANQVAALLENTLHQRRLEELAQRDGMTGLYNRRVLNERLREAFLSAERFQKNMSLLIIDLDHFKGINDRYGHPQGDEVLRKVASILQTKAREIDITARYGGEEFVMILDATPIDGALRLADRIRKAISELEFSFVTNDTLEPEEFRVTASIGIASYPLHADEPDLLLQHADAALYQAKRRGRNRVVSYALRQERAKTNPQEHETEIPLVSIVSSGWGWGSVPNAQDSQVFEKEENWSSLPYSSCEEDCESYEQENSEAYDPEALNSVQTPPEQQLQHLKGFQDKESELLPSVPELSH